MFKKLHVRLNERSVVFRHGLPVRAYGPGRHWLWGTNLAEQRWDTAELVFRALPEVRAVLPRDWYEEITLRPDQRGVLYRDRLPVAYLRPGVHRYWTVDPAVELSIHDVHAPLPVLTPELLAVIPRSEYLDITVEAHQKALRIERGRVVGVLDPGRYTLWTRPETPTRIEPIDLRRVELSIAGQELMTRDKVTLRLTLTVDYAITDPVQATQKVTSVRDSVYVATQLAARRYVGAVTLDQLLEARDEMTRSLEQSVVPQAAAIGVHVESIGVKDIVLPGDMKTLLNRVIEAEKEAAANVILRREETAATRSLANTARMMVDQPMLLRLKELDTLKEIAERIQQVHLIVGADGLKTFLPGGLLSDPLRAGPSERRDAS